MPGNSVSRRCSLQIRLSRSSSFTPRAAMRSSENLLWRKAPRVWGSSRRVLGMIKKSRPKGNCSTDASGLKARQKAKVWQEDLFCVGLSVRQAYAVSHTQLSDEHFNSLLNGSAK